MFHITLNNGVSIPVLGLGVYQTKGEEMIEAVSAALDAGYTSFDTAKMYGNEAELASALKKSSACRKDIFITSKVEPSAMGYEGTMNAFMRSLDQMQTDYLDLFLIHWPGQKQERCVETWRALEELYKRKLVRAIGVSNFCIRHLEWLLKSGSIIPAVNQVEHNHIMDDRQLFAFCKQHGIACEAWAPIGRGRFEFEILSRLSEKYQKTPAQIVLRWNIDCGYIVIPKSVHRARIFENADIFDFELSMEDMAKIADLATGERTSYDPETYDF